MLPQDQLQQFLVRCVTGYGDRVQSDISDSELSEATDKLSQFAGLASLSFKSREKLRSLVEEALMLDGAVTADFAYTEALKTTLVYIANAQKSIRAPKYRKLKKSSKVFCDIILQAPACLKLLDIAGTYLNSHIFYKCNMIRRSKLTLTQDLKRRSMLPWARKHLS